MRSDLDVLIDFYEAEKLSLETLIKENLKEHEYLGVYYYGEELLRVNGQLHKLYCFKDPFYEQNQQLERLMVFEISNEKSYLQSFWKERVKTEKERIEKLRNENRANFNDSQELDDALFSLYEERYSGLKLYFSHEENPFYIEFKVTKQKILHIIIEKNRIINYNDSETNRIRLFENLGFKLNYNNDLLIYEYNMAGFRDAILIKTLLARIIYDIGYFSKNKEAKLEYIK